MEKNKVEPTRKDDLNEDVESPDTDSSEEEEDEEVNTALDEMEEEGANPQDYAPKKV